MAPASRASAAGLSLKTAKGAMLARGRHNMLRLRGGEDDSEAKEEEGGDEPAAPTTMIERLKANQSTNPSDHTSMLEWGIAVLLSIYAAIGAPFSCYIPIIRDLAVRKPIEKPLTEAEKQRMEREALRKEQDEEFAQTMMEDKLKEADRRKKKEAAAAAENAAKREAEAKNNAVATFTARIAELKAKQEKEPAAGNGVVMLRFRCPDGTQLTRKFKTADPISVLYDYVDVARHDKAQNTADPSIHLAELAVFDYQLVSTMPKLILSDRATTLKDAGITTSCALVVQPIVSD
eukprot:CAMPEP_0173394174 /NCGR_PEP_ID=MMETSP1356-20130122/25557_1 /TAXON_ID=77927 ORGANISM="Hemiselmis virescens, Strain PCC157" /NCGR_SAMPLE_ID=MMETSP1356 /ASSEMBLY_ACC=CAM_ASM_000847 /LENGTH=290 /DNA_ID=CAMNT_0014352405 /DNA_START=22 /DNA_END=894 /DNA_ORIENTATION=+